MTGLPRVRSGYIPKHLNKLIFTLKKIDSDRQCPKFFAAESTLADFDEVFHCAYDEIGLACFRFLGEMLDFLGRKTMMIRKRGEFHDFRLTTGQGFPKRFRLGDPGKSEYPLSGQKIDRGGPLAEKAALLGVDLRIVVWGDPKRGDQHAWPVGDFPPDGGRGDFGNLLADFLPPGFWNQIRPGQKNNLGTGQRTN